MAQTLVFATNNAHKLQEARAIVGDAFVIKSLAEIGCHDDIPENGATLQENAIAKALWVKQKYGYDCFADDTGLMVEALGGRPGVYSARYAGPECNADANIDLLLSELKGAANRNAYFETCIALATDDGIKTVSGRVDGTIATERHGGGGFGYDPVFIPVEAGISFAEMDADGKNRISHRGRALHNFIDLLRKLT